MNKSDLQRLQERLEAADESLRRLADEYARRARTDRGIDAINYWAHYDRLTAKAEGVRLSVSYIEEMLREY